MKKYTKSVLNSFRVICIYFIVISQSLYSQVPFDKALKLNTSNGLENNWITTVEEDEDGIAWLGAIEGFYRWDGISVEGFFPNEDDSTSISSLHISDVMPDIRNDKVWVASRKGLSVYNIKSKVFTNFKNNSEDTLSIPDKKVSRIFKDNNDDIWIGLTNGGLLKYSEEKNGFERFLNKDSPNDLNEEHSGISVIDIKEDLENDSILWLGTTNGIIEFNKINYQFNSYFYQAEDKIIEKQYNNIRFITVHPNGKIYYAIWWKGMCSFDIKTKSFDRIIPEYKNKTTPLGRTLINGFHQEPNEQIWINSNKGMQLYDIPSNSIIKQYLNTDKRWYSIDHVDKQGRIWSATHNNGLYIFNPLLQQYEVSYYEDFDINFPCYTRKILLDSLDQKIYVASEYSKGLYILDLKTDEWNCVLPPEDFNLSQMGGFRASDLIRLEKDKILIIIDSGIYIYQPGFKRLKKYKLQPDKNFNQLAKIIKDKFGDYWITSYKGTVYKLNHENGELYNYKDEIKAAIPGECHLMYICEDQRGNIWIRDVKGLLIFDRKNNKFIYHDKSKNGESIHGQEQILSDNNGRVWISTSANKFGYGHMDSLEVGIINLTDKSDGLKGKEIYLVLPDKDDVHIFSDKCVQVYNTTENTFTKSIDKKYLPKSVVHFDPEIKGDQLIFGTIRGIAFINLKNISTNQEKPVPYVRSMHAFDELIPVRAKPGTIDSVLLSYKQNFFSFDLSAVNYNLPELTRFEYMLKGYDDEWIDGTERKFAAYTKVPGGEYQFIIRAFNNEGIQSENPSITYLNISTVWWKTTWFLTMMAIIILSLMILLYKYRITQVRNEEQLKTEYERKLADVELSALRAQMNPHFIFNSLNSIEYYIISNEPVLASDYLNRFSRLIRLILQNSKNSIVPIKDDIEALKLYIELESMRFDQLFDYEVKLENGIDIQNTFVPPMLLQPYVENAIWHGLLQKQGGRGKIEITISKTEHGLKCVIEDNGIGRKAAEELKSKTATKQKSYGMKITSDRLDMLNNLAGTNASVKIIDLYDEDQSPIGTRVELIIPV